MQRDKHFWSLLLRLLPGDEMHALKHLSRTVCTFQMRSSMCSTMLH
jgi:hypothetical protein